MKSLLFSNLLKQNGVFCICILFHVLTCICDEITVFSPERPEQTVFEKPDINYIYFVK